MRSYKRLSRGFTLVELMIVVAIIGVLAALAIFGVTRYLGAAKTSEAKNTIGAISRNAQEAFSKEQNAAEFVADNTVGTQFSQDLCGTSNYSLTTGIPSGRKAQPVDTTFSLTGAGNSKAVGWQCLRFEMHDPTYYRYGYVANRISALPPGESVGNAGAPPSKLTSALAMPATGFFAYAEGNLNGDGTTSAFGIAGQVNLAERTLKTSTQPVIVDEGE